jgi:hypothetical protein
MATLFLAAGFMALGVLPVQAALPPADELLGVLGYSAAEKSRIEAGEFVSRSVESTSERDLVASFAFEVNMPPGKVNQALQNQLNATNDPDTIAFGVIAGPATLDAFADLSLGPNAASRVQQYLKAEPGDDLNLHADEIAAFTAIRSQSKDLAALQDLVTQQVSKALLARVQAYQEKGLEGIPPYARKGGAEGPAAGDLRRASDAAVHTKNYLPDFHAILTGYPGTSPDDVEERFEWLSFNSRGTPVFILMHNFSMQEGDAYVHVQRQFYVSAGYNVEQAIGAVFPTKTGSLVIYTNHFSTEQVTGFGHSAKHAVGQRIMAKQLLAFFERIRSEAEALDK